MQGWGGRLRPIGRRSAFPALRSRAQMSIARRAVPSCRLQPRFPNAAHHPDRRRRKAHPRWAARVLGGRLRRVRRGQYPGGVERPRGGVGRSRAHRSAAGRRGWDGGGGKGAGAAAPAHRDHDDGVRLRGRGGGGDEARRVRFRHQADQHRQAGDADPSRAAQPQDGGGSGGAEEAGGAPLRAGAAHRRIAGDAGGLRYDQAGGARRAQRC